MVVAFGFKAHSGWAALVALSEAGRRIVVTDRHRVELAGMSGGEWARQTYHATEGLLEKTASALKTQVGAPWTKDHKEAAIAAMMVLES